MKWTIAWFFSQEEKWKKRADWAKTEKLEGHKCYAEKQVYIWEKMKEKCKKEWRYE
jgi:hypothetical protein